MSNIMSRIYTYREALKRIGCKESKKIMSESEIHNEMNELISAVNSAEDSLKEVVLINKSYKEILKMVM